MDSGRARATRDLPKVSRNIALLGALVSRLMAFCLLYFAPALAYEQDSSTSATTATILAGTEPSAGESLDPKHEKDRDGGREAEHEHEHRRRGPG